MPVTFTITDEQDLEIARWEKAHLKECRIKHPEIVSGMFTFRFTPIGVRSIITVECHCGMRKDVTKY